MNEAVEAWAGQQELSELQPWQRSLFERTVAAERLVLMVPRRHDYLDPFLVNAIAGESGPRRDVEEPRRGVRP